MLAARQRCKLREDGETLCAAGPSLLCLTLGGSVRTYPAKRNPPAMGTLDPLQWKFSRAAEGSSDGLAKPKVRRLSVWKFGLLKLGAHVLCALAR